MLAMETSPLKSGQQASEDVKQASIKSIPMKARARMRYDG